MNKKIVKDRISNYYIDFNNKELNNVSSEAIIEVIKFYKGLLKEIDRLDMEENISNSMMSELSIKFKE